MNRAVSFRWDQISIFKEKKYEEGIETTRAAMIEQPPQRDRERADKPPFKPKFQFLDFRKLLTMTDVEAAKQAWPTDAKFSKVHSEFLTRPIDKQNSLWAEDSCKHCFWRKQNADHSPLRCEKLRAFITSNLNDGPTGCVYTL